MENKTLNIALPKGRLGEKAYTLLADAGYDCPDVLSDSRKLVYEDRTKGIRYFWVKPSDVAIYVERGSADLGIVGSDILQEYKPEVYELCDLGIGKCRMAVAGQKDRHPARGAMLRVATKFPHIAHRFYSRKSQDIDIIRLNGSIELAPLLGLSDVIVDIVETGKTLAENGLVELEEICPVSARLIANRVSYKFAYREVSALQAAVEALLDGKEAAG